MTDKLKIRTTLNRPLEWLGDEAWTYLADYSERNEYAVLDEIFRYFSDGTKREDLSENLASMTDEELKTEYLKRFPVMLGEALADLGRDIKRGDVFDFVIEDL